MPQSLPPGVAKTRVLLAGDSWAQYMWDDGSHNLIFDRYGSDWAIEQRFGLENDIYPDLAAVRSWEYDPARLETLRDLPANTKDGVHISLYGNIEFPYEVDHCRDRGADGIGLYRTEFLYLRGALPDEETQYRYYGRLIAWDLGADICPGLGFVKRPYGRQKAVSRQGVRERL